MSHRVSREAFAEMLARVEPGRSTKNYIQQSSCYVFRGGWLYTFNDEIWCCTKTGFPDAVEGAVQGRHLKETLEGMSAEHVDVSVTATEMVLAAARARVGVRLEAKITLPLDDVDMPAAWVPLQNPDAFSKAVRQVCETAGRQEEEFMTVCVHLAPGVMESTDRYQATRYEVDTGVTRDFLVRAKSLKHLAQLDVTKVGETDNWVHFRNKALIISMRRHAEAFHDLAPFFAFQGTPVDLPRGAAEGAKLAGVFSSDDKDDDKVTVCLEPGRMRVRGQGANGWAEAEPECSYQGPPVEFRISPETLETLVADHQKCEISDRKLLVRGDHWAYISVLGSATPAAAPARAGRPAPADDADEPVYAEDDDE